MKRAGLLVIVAGALVAAILAIWFAIGLVRRNAAIAQDRPFVIAQGATLTSVANSNWKTKA